MDRSRDIQDFCALASVRRRRGTALQARLGEARREHRECLARQAQAQEIAGSRCDALGAYRLALVERTAAGKGVSLDQLQAARAHCLALEESCDEAAKSVSAAAHAVDQALSAIGQLVRDIAANDARVESLTQEVRRWRTALATAAEDREEDERPERRRTPPG